MNRLSLVFSILLLPATALASSPPLPEAPVRLVIPDVPAFDAALGGGFRQALTGSMDAENPVLRAWRQTQVGAKLETQWEAFSSDLSWTWNDILATRAHSLGLAVLSAASLEMVLVLDTPLATLPVPFPQGTPATHEGLPYAVVTRGAGDGASDDRRAGFAWARVRGHLILATSERAMRLTLEEVAANRGFAPPLPGLASLDLDMDVLSRDLYFSREYLFGTAGISGHVRAALRLEEGRIVEVREGGGASVATAFAFDTAGTVASGWETDTSRLWPALRAALLETVPAPAPRPVPPLSPLPSAGAPVSNRYLVDLTRPAVLDNAPWEKGDLATWEGILPGVGWGWMIGSDRSRSVVFEAPEEGFEDAIVATLTRRAGRVAVVRTGDIAEFRVGPAIPVLATRRTGAFLWISTSAAALARVTSPRQADSIVSWSRLDLAGVRKEGEIWSRAEGPASPDRVRPFSDRLLGLLGWMPDTRTISVERTKRASGWSERVVFGRVP